jgi:hypothetical protein
VVARDIAISGFDNGRVLAVSIADGATVWDSPVSPSTGRTELERLNDIDAAVKVVGDDVFVVGYQGRAAMLSLDPARSGGRARSRVIAASTSMMTRCTSAPRRAGWWHSSAAPALKCGATTCC